MRYALYFTPPKDDPLTRACRPLARPRRLFRRDFIPTTPSAHVPEDHDDLDRRATPLRVSRHAEGTLRARSLGRPSATSWRSSADFAARTPTFAIPELVLGQLGHFFALVPGAVYPTLQDFAARVVKTFEPFRAALSDADIARRKPEGLTEAQRANLLRWGYPYVMDEFRFHMTLTGPVATERQAARFMTCCANALPLISASRSPFPALPCSSKKTRGAPFTVRSWLPLAGAQS